MSPPSFVVRLLPILLLASCVSTAPTRRYSIGAAAQPSHSSLLPGMPDELDDQPIPAPRRSHFKPKSGLYVTIGLMRGAVSGEDFNGVGGVSGGGSSEIMPLLDDGTGVAFGIGTRVPGFAWEFNVSTLDHDSRHASRSGNIESETRNFNFDFRFSLKNTQRVQPYFLAGFGFSSLRVQNGSVGGSQVEDAVYSGLGLSLGIGANFYATESVIFGLEVGQRFVSYASVDGVVDGSLDSSASGSGNFFGLRASFTF